MRDRAQEMDNVQLDIETLRTMIDVALDRGADSDDALLQACAEVLSVKRRRLNALEAVTLYVSRGDTDPPVA